MDGLVWFGPFYGISTFVGYLMPNPFYVNNQFYLKQFSFAVSLSKTFLFQTLQTVIYKNSWLVGLLGFMAYQPLKVI